jgi:hypothetical protein
MAWNYVNEPLITKSGQVKLTKLKSDEPQGLELQGYLAKHQFQHSVFRLFNVSELMSIFNIHDICSLSETAQRFFREKV